MDISTKIKLNKLFTTKNIPSVVHKPNNPHILKGDSGASNHYLSPTSSDLLQNVRTNTSLKVHLPDNAMLSSSHSGQLDIPKLSIDAKTAHILPGLADTSLLSLGQLADDGCIILLNKQYLQVFKNFELILQGFRNKNDGLWDIPFPTNTTPATNHHQITNHNTLNIITRKNQSTKTLIQYLHATLFSPSKSTLLQAIRNNHLIGWPGLTVENVNKYLDETPATAKGHLDQHRKNLQSTGKHNSNDLTQAEPFEKTHQTMATIITSTNPTNAYFDLTGQFPYTSARGFKYIFVLYDHDSNAILVEPLKTKNAGEIKNAWLKLHLRLNNSGLFPKTYIIDNEASTEIKQAIKKYKLNYQLTPPHMHRINAAERAIRTFKNHLLAGLASLDPKFPINEWDRLLPQAEITLNLLRPSRIHPHLSAYSMLQGHYDFNKNPMAPPGTRIVMHTKPTKRAAWGYHGEDGFYIGPALEHYRCVQCLMTSSRHVRISDTVQFFPHATPFPHISLSDRLCNALNDIVSTLASPDFKLNHPNLQYNDQTLMAIQVIANMLHRMVPKPPLPPFMPIKQQSSSPEPTTPSSATPPAHVPRVPQSSSVRQPSPSPPVVQVPRVIPKSRRHAHSVLKQRANSTIQVRPIAQSLLKRLLHIYNKITGKKETLKSLLNNELTRPTWEKASSNEYGRLMTGNDAGVKGTTTMQPIALTDIPTDCKITYGTMVCDHRPLKSEPNRCRLVVGGDRLTYDNETAAPAANLLEAKLIFNSVISTANAKFFTMDIKDFFLSSTMPKKEYMKMHLTEIPEDIINRYNMRDIQDKNGYVHFQINKGMYGLKQAAILAYQQLKDHLAPHGYYPIPNTVGMWKHTSRPIQFCLCVDDFGVKYTRKEDAEHLLTTLQKKYTMTCDWTGKSYCGLTLDWNYQQKYVDISMPGYIEKLLKKLKHPQPPRPVHAPHQWTKPVYGRHIQQCTADDTSPLLQPKEITLIQSIVGALLYYTRAVDPSMYPALNEVSLRQATPTKYTLQQCTQLLDYVATHPNATIRYHASDMILNVDSDAAYLVLPRARSRLAGHFFLSSAPSPARSVLPNGPILTECKTIRHVVSSAAEAETAGLFHNAQQARPIRYILTQLGHPQPPTPIKTDNATANAFIHQTMRHKKSKSWDMRYWWLKENSAQSEFDIFWDKGVNNWADYFTKHFSPSVHQVLRPRYVHRTNLILAAVRTSLLRTLSARVC